MERNREEFYASLREQLIQQTEWPTVYMFKFIVPAKNKTLARVMELFGPDAEVSTRNSSKGSYISITAREVMIDADQIIEVYQRAELIDGIISL